MFHDDCLTEDREWVIAFCQAYRAAGFTQPFFCQSRADIIVKNEDMVKMMAEAGLRGYLIGFESGSDRVLKFIRKGTKRQQNLDETLAAFPYVNGELFREHDLDTGKDHGLTEFDDDSVVFPAISRDGSTLAAAS